MIHNFRVTDSIPFPARNLVAFVQSQLKLSRHQAEALVHCGAIVVNKRLAVQNHVRLEVGDRVDIEYIPQPVLNRVDKAKAGKATSHDFSIMYDDEEIIVVNKPAGLLTVPTPYRERNTMLGLLQRYHERRRNAEEIICVHRLDRGVSGVLVFAKSLPVGMKIREQFAARKPSRVYIAIVAGQVAKTEGSYRSYLATDADLNRYSTSDTEAGQLAITHWQRETVYADATMLRVQLETGRRNQIRVHLAEDRHPILGDPRYESAAAKHANWHHRRIALHAESLGFAHPRTGESMKFQTEWPQEFKTFHREMR